MNKFNIRNPPHYCQTSDGDDIDELIHEVQIEIDLIEEGQEAAELYTKKQVNDLRRWLEKARKQRAT